jgi:hypothetical protein
MDSRGIKCRLPTLTPPTPAQNVRSGVDQAKQETQFQHEAWCRAPERRGVWKRRSASAL